MNKFYKLTLTSLALFLFGVGNAMADDVKAYADNYYLRNADTGSGARRALDVVKNDNPGDCVANPDDLIIEIVTPPTLGTVQVRNGRVNYSANAGVYGRDEFEYKITCPDNGGSSSSAKVFIELVGQIPDFIDEAECTVDPLPFQWDIEKKFESNVPVYYLTSPLVGNLDGASSDPAVNAPEIVCFARANNVPKRVSNAQNSDEVLVFDNKLQLKHRFAIMNTAKTDTVGVDNYFGHPLAIGDVDGDGKGEIIVAAGVYDGHKLRCYTQDGTLKWVSNDGVGNEVSYFAKAMNKPPYGNTNHDNGSGANPVVADMDGDGLVEILVGDRIFDGQTGRLLATLPDGKTASGYLYGRGYRKQTPTRGGSTYQPVIADVDGDGIMEVIAGNATYKISINRDNPALSTATVLALVDQPDGLTSVADIDADNLIDVIVVRCNEQRDGTAISYNGTMMYAWKGHIPTMLGVPQKPLSATGTVGGSGSRAFIGDIDNDGIPEVCFTYAGMMAAYRYKNGSFQSLWTGKTTSDTSGATTMTMFDFNLDGEAELVYRDETDIRILDKNGNNVIDKDGNPAIFSIYSATHTEYPVVVDLDGDGHAEILVSGANKFQTGELDPGGSGIVMNSQGLKNQYDTRLQVFGSVSKDTWAPARNVWHQHGYNPLWINKDLSVPARPMASTEKVIHRDGTTHRPFNNFLQQAGYLNSEGESLILAPDLAFQLGKSQQLYYNAATKDMEVTCFLTNLGDLDYKGDILLSLYIYQISTGQYRRVGFQVFNNQTLDMSENKTLVMKVANYDAIEPTLPPATDYKWLVSVNLNDDSPNAPKDFYNGQRECNEWNSITSDVSFISGYIVLCEGEKGNLEIQPQGVFDCYWYEEDGVTPYAPDGTNLGDTKEVTKKNDSDKEYYLIDVRNKANNLPVSPKKDTVFVYKAVDSLIWTGSVDEDWNKYQNWKHPSTPVVGDVNRFKYIPRGCTNVLIPSNNDAGLPITTLPNLTQGVSDYGTTRTYLDVRCNNITLEFGAEVKRSDMLYYSKAFVQLELENNRWYCFSSPLRDMNAGDIYVSDPNPFLDDVFVYTRFFSQKNIDGKYVQGSWNGTFSRPNVKFEVGAGLGIWLDNSQPLAPTESAQFLQFPKLDKGYFTYDKNGNQGDLFFTTDKVAPHRFIYEENMNAVSKDIKLAVTGQSAGEKFLMGNPFMSHLDFDEFYNYGNNSEYIENYYEIMDETGSYATYYISGGVSTGTPVLTKDIAPMQSVLLTPKKAFAKGTLVINPAHSVLIPGATLRNAKAENKEPNAFLRVSISDDKVRNRAALIYDAKLGASAAYNEGLDVQKILRQGAQPNPSVYFITGDGLYTDIKVLSSLDKIEIPIGITCDATGPMALAFENLPIVLSEFDVVLIDKEKNEETPLKNSVLYIHTFNKTTSDRNMDNRFAIRFSRSISGVEDENNNNESDSRSLTYSSDRGHTEVYTTNGDLISEYEICDLQGRVVAKKNNINDSRFSLYLQQGIYIVKAKVADSTTVLKIIIK